MSGPEDINSIPPEPADVEPTEKVESIESAKLIKDEVIRAIKVFGMKDLASVDLLQRYTDQCEAEYVKQGRTDAHPEALREKAHVLAKSENYFWAIKVIEDVITIATLEGDKESVEEAEWIMSKIKEKLLQDFTPPPAPEKITKNESIEEISYEEVLKAFRKLSSKATDPQDLDIGDAEVKQANKLFNDWSRQQELKTKDNYDDYMRFSLLQNMLFIEAGFHGRDYLEDVKSWLYVNDSPNIPKDTESSDRVELRKDMADALRKVRNLLKE
jgi:hypothetical protein